MDTDRSVSLFRAKLCIMVGRFEESYGLMKNLVDSLHNTEEDLTGDERELLMVAFYCLLMEKRRICKDLSPMYSEKFGDVIVDVKCNTCKEARSLCGDMLNLLEKLVRRDSPEAKTYYTKAKGDVNWSLLQFVDANFYDLVLRRAKQCYSLAEDLSRKFLPISCITRLQTVYSSCMFNWNVIQDETYPRSTAMEAKTLFEEEQLEQEDAAIAKILASLDLFTGESEDVVYISWLPENAASDIIQSGVIALT